MTLCPVIARVAPRRCWPDRDTPVIDLILPYDLANYGRIMTWDQQGGHCEAALDYYYETKAPRSPAEVEAAERAVRLYRRHYDDAEDPVVERQRLPHDWREHAWAQA